jgi:putative intracellular protease/amidase
MKHYKYQVTRTLFLVLVLALSGINGRTQQKQKFNVAIFLFQGVELLDFAGPGEAFASTPDFMVYTVSVDGKEVLSEGFVTVKPQYSMDDAPVPEIVVFPGGNVNETSNNQKVLDWINRLVSQGATAMSVCNGAGILAKTGLLKGLNVTTHHGYISRLRTMLPNSTVLDDTKYVDNGNIITTAGVSAGIDGALHVITRIKGKEVAKSVAIYMEYNKWRPEQGRVDFKNEWLEKMKDQSQGLEIANKAIMGREYPNAQIPYEGELMDLGSELLYKGMYQEAANSMEQAVKWYPCSASCYSILSQAYIKLGKSAPVDEDEFLRIIDSGKIDEAISAYEKTRKAFPGWQLFDERTLNSAGYNQLQKENYSNAVKVFLLNCKAFPKSWNVWDSLAEAYMKAGNKMDAITNYKRSLELNPKNDNAKLYLTQLESK